MTKIKPRLIARISCQECRRRKTRCNFDGQGEKCSTCARIGTPCIFSQKNGTILDMDRVLEENNPHLAHRKEKEQRARDRAKLASTSSSTSVNGTLSPDISLRSRPFPSISASPLYSSDSVAHNSNCGRQSGSNTVSEQLWHHNVGSASTDELSSVMDRLQIDAFGIAPHTLRSFSQVAGDNDSLEPSSAESTDSDEPTSSPPLLQEVEQRGNSPKDTSACAKLHHPPNNNQPSCPISEAPTMSGTAAALPPSRQRSSRSRSVPTLDIQYELIDLYFRHVHPFLLVLHKPTFFRRLHDPKDPVPDFLLAAVYAVASHYAPGREQDGRMYFQLWLSHLDSTLDKPRLSTIQALLMIIKYQEGVKNTGFYFRTYMYTQMVIVLARELQLHKATHVNAKLDPENHEIRRRLFWAIFVLDQFLAVSQGRTMSFREVEPEADLPRTDNEDPNDLEEIETIENAVEYIKLVKIDHQALILVRKYLTKVAATEETIPQSLFLHQAMLAWKANLPPRLQLATNMSPHTPFVAMLHILYHACAIMVQRCYCEDPSISDLEITAISRDTRTISATNITVIVDELYSNHGMVPLTYPVRGCYFIIYCLIAAATIQVNDIRQGTNGPIMFKRSLALLNVILRQSTAMDVEKEIALLKSSLDTQMEGSDRDEDMTFAPSRQYNYRRPPRLIAPLTQKHGSRLQFGHRTGTRTRIRKISPKVTIGDSGGVSSNTQLDNGTRDSERRIRLAQTTDNMHRGPATSQEEFPTRCLEALHSTSNQTSINSRYAAMHSSHKQVVKGGQPSATAVCNTDGDTLVTQHLRQIELSIFPDENDDLNVAIKSSPSPDLPSRSIVGIVDSLDQNSACYNEGAQQSDFLMSHDLALQPVPAFTTPVSLQPDFDAFAAAQRELSATSLQNPSSLLQHFAFQEQQQQYQPESSDLGAMTPVQMQGLNLFNQHRQLMQLQHQQQSQYQQQQEPQHQQQVSDPEFVEVLLSSFSNLNNFRQIDSDRAQLELLSMLNSSPMAYNDNRTSNMLPQESARSYSPELNEQVVIEQPGTRSVEEANTAKGSSSKFSAPDAAAIYLTA
ncbi:hypothetical protein BG004_000030 [Podila humilis]|nr:hypothetical protein BG004_000030 [Podila humilis]